MTQLRNRLKNDMLNSLLHILVNGPETGANITKDIIGKAVQRWGEKKNHRMVKKVPADAGQKTTAEKSEQPVLVDEAVQVQLQEYKLKVVNICEIHGTTALKLRCLTDFSDM